MDPPDGIMQTIVRRGSFVGYFAKFDSMPVLMMHIGHVRVRMHQRRMVM